MFTTILIHPQPPRLTPSAAMTFLVQTKITAHFDQATSLNFLSSNTPVPKNHSYTPDVAPFPP